MIGKRIHSYEVNAHLGQGGMGDVFRATDSMLGREVALKMLHPRLTMEPQFLERFKKEARVLAQLLHPNIAVIYNFIEQDDNHFMVMEYVEGTSLDDLLKKYGALPADFVVPVSIQALEGLQHAHRKNIYHRDIKPANLMITEDATLKLMDFGIAKVAGEQKMTQVNKIVGTIEFMAPELIEGKDASPASDIYAMGATLYELVSGKIPFEGDTDFNLMQAILKSRIKPPVKINPSIPVALNDIVLKAMDKNPEHRYPNARAFQQALITAFPRYREIDIDVLRKAQQRVYADTNAGEPAQWSTSPGISALETRVEHSAPVEGFLRYKRKILSNRKLSLIILAFLFFVVAVVSINAMRGDTTDDMLAAKGDSVVNVNPTQYRNPSSDNVGNDVPVNNGQVIDMPERTPEVAPQVPDGEQRDAENRNEKPKKNAKTPVTEPRQKPDEKTEDEEVPVEVAVKPVEIKDIYITSDVLINLTLASNPDVNLKPKAPQPVRFTVSQPVVYNGVTIIRQGATAHGTIEIGKISTDIEITSVDGANGKRVTLRSKGARGKRKDVEIRKPFYAIVPRGTRMTF